MYFILFKDSQGQWRWNLNADNHKKIADGAEGYNNRQDCLHGVNLVKANAATSPVYDKTMEQWI